MHSTSVTSHGAANRRYRPTPAREPAAARAHADVSFVALLDSYRHSGGLARAEEVSRRLERHFGLDSAILARWITERSVIAFEWQAQTWLPWFQFAHAGQSPAAVVTAVLTELDPVFDGWEVAQWFARPNAALGDRAPVDMLDDEPEAVLAAARSDRYVAKG